MDTPFDEWSTHNVPISSSSVLPLASSPPAACDSDSNSADLNGRIRKEPLKRGRHGETWKGSMTRESGPRQQVAIKVIKLKPVRGEESMPLIQLDSVADVKVPLQEFLEYARERKLIRHKSIEPFLGVCADLQFGSAAPSSISPWHELGDHRARKAEQLAEALHFLHSRDIVHGNLVPSNTLIGPFYRVCITD
ncbi:hypothetical protein CONPUDRAFT_152633 [Coniophora puteana RWD-64-598 SS2]|uniref:Protein kinase domain-containing protein n=1 Tax=Coniophora puteana (strain RWD-64-598) TaxID=741705 RepID=A0A5M3MRD8_CONPW|nr:uncharacterized protein CONPUDRAFT_152633 [Coniophora puteana RWD-64-598 SS2]EIW81719.1 hypothetical protein CONPUDRAFT_152633 [Coniophora puteana RWD-64-598 SS2]